MVLGFAGISETLTPFASQWLLSVNSMAAIVTYAVIGMFAGLAAACLPLETRGRPLLDTVSSRVFQEDF